MGCTWEVFPAKDTVSQETPLYDGKRFKTCQIF